jgi:hypothetical protein
MSLDRGRVVALLVVVALSASGCLVTSTSSSGMGYPAGPSLEQFGVRERCPQGGDCIDRATDAVEAALGRLEEQIDATLITTTDGPPPDDRLYVDVDRDPPMEWRLLNGMEGTSQGVMVDLTDDDPYVVVAPGLAFRLSAEDAAAIRDALFVEE